MRITAVARFKQADLWAALKQLGWSQADLARNAKMCQRHVAEIINMKKRPSTMAANKIQRALGVGGVYLDVLSMWPEEFKGFGQKAPVVERTQEIPIEHLLAAHPSTPPLLDIHKQELNDVLDTVLATLTEQEQEVLDRRFGLTGASETLGEIADDFGRTRDRIRQIEAKALRKLRHPYRLDKIIEVTPFAVG